MIPRTRARSFIVFAISNNIAPGVFRGGGCRRLPRTTTRHHCKRSLLFAYMRISNGGHVHVARKRMLVARLGALGRVQGTSGAGGTVLRALFLCGCAGRPQLQSYKRKASPPRPPAPIAFDWSPVDKATQRDACSCAQATVHRAVPPPTLSLR